MSILTDIIDAVIDGLKAAWNAITSVFSTKPVSSPTQGCAATPLSDLSKSTPRYDSLPQTVSLSKEACDTMQKLTDQSIDAKGNSTEHAGTLVTDPQGKLLVVNEKSGASGDVTPSTSAPKDHIYIGTFHTHPYGKNDGTWDGAHMPFSGGDVGTLDNFKEKVSVVQSGPNKYVLVQTDQTPSTISTIEADKEYDKVFDAEYAAQQKLGKTDAESASIAGEKATAALAKKYNLGYYKGTDCASLSRVNP